MDVSHYNDIAKCTLHMHLGLFNVDGKTPNVHY